jgi:hypothetical protein
MISFTAPDGSKVKIDAKRVVRARRTVSGESSNAETRIDWAIMNLVQEPIDDVARQIRKELESFTSLTSRDGSKIWFDATQAVGPLALTPSQSDGVVKSSIKLMGYRQFVTEDAAQVRAVLTKAGGSPLSMAVRTTKVARRKRRK